MDITKDSFEILIKINLLFLRFSRDPSSKAKFANSVAGVPPKKKSRGFEKEKRGLREGGRRLTFGN